MDEMNFNNFAQQFEQNLDKILSNHSIDCVIFSYENEELKVLLSHSNNNHLNMLPGGFIFLEEDIDSAAQRIIKERIGLEGVFLNQFYTFGAVNRRSQKEINQMEISFLNSRPKLAAWHKSRFITTGYLSFVNFERAIIQPDPFGTSYKWHSVYNLPKLIFDHQNIVKKAIKTLRTQLDYLPIGASLLPPRFTMNEMQSLHESILNTKLDRGNFQRKVLKSKLLNRHEKLMKGGAHKAPYLYSF